MSSPRRYSPSVGSFDLESLQQSLRHEMMEMVVSLRGDVAENFEIAQAAIQQAEVCMGAMEQHQENINIFEQAVRHDQNEVVEAVRRLARAPSRGSSEPRNDEIIQELTASVESVKGLCISNTGSIQSDVVTLSAQVEHLQQQNSKLKTEMQTMQQHQTSFAQPGSGTIRQFRSFEARLESLQKDMTSLSNTVKKLQGTRSIDQHKQRESLKQKTSLVSTGVDLSELLERIEILEKRDAKAESEESSQKTSPGPVFEASVEPNDKQWLFEKVLELEERISTLPTTATPVSNNNNNNELLEKIRSLEHHLNTLSKNDESHSEEIQMLNCRIREGGSENLDAIVVEVGNLREVVKTLQDNTSSPDITEVVRRCAALDARLDSIYNTVETLEMKSPNTNMRDSDLYIQDSPSPQLLTPSASVDFTDVRQDIVDLKEAVQVTRAEARDDLKAQHAALSDEINKIRVRVDDFSGAEADNKQQLEAIKGSLQSDMRDQIQSLQQTISSDLESALSSMPAAAGITADEVNDIITDRLADNNRNQQQGKSLDTLIDDLYIRQDRLETNFSVDSIKQDIQQDVQSAINSIKAGSAAEEPPVTNASIMKLSGDIAEIMGDVGDLAERMELVEEQLGSG